MVQEETKCISSKSLGFTRQKQELIIHWRKSWTQEPLVVFSLDTRKEAKAIGFIVQITPQELLNLGKRSSQKILSVI